MGSFLKIFALVLAMAGAVQAQGLSALARVDPANSGVANDGRGIALRLDLSQPVPYRVRTLDAPPRLVLDFNEVDWSGVREDQLLFSDRVKTLRFGAVGQGWSRLVLDLSGPYAVKTAEIWPDKTTGRAVLQLVMTPTTQQEFAAHAAPPEAALWGLPQAHEMPAPRRRQDGSRPVRVVLDPGHGGIDPGAERGGVKEANLVLTFARELRDVLRRAGFEVTLTRDDDVFVPLEERVSIARAAQADLFISLHADILPGGHASGATVYTLSDTASDEASKKLAERHDRGDLLAGVDLTHQDDVIAGVLMGMARLETAPRADQLADDLVAGLKHAVGRLHKRPRQWAGFSVLKAPDIPSVLIELGFLSSPRDLANLTDPEWRGKAAVGIRDALLTWARDDAAQAALLRK